jgi:hypothetical protein
MMVMLLSGDDVSNYFTLLELTYDEIVLLREMKSTINVCEYEHSKNSK